MTERIATDSSKIDSSMNAVRISWRAPLSQGFGVAVLSALGCFHAGLPVAFAQNLKQVDRAVMAGDANTEVTEPANLSAKLTQRDLSAAKRNVADWRLKRQEFNLSRH